MSTQKLRYLNNKSFYEKLKHNKQYGGDDEKWKCDVCHYINTGDADICIMCGTPKGQKQFLEQTYPNEKFLLEINKQNFKIVNKKIPGLGNCLFDSLITGFNLIGINNFTVYGKNIKIDSAKTFRSEIFSFMSDHKEDISNNLVYDETNYDVLKNNIKDNIDIYRNDDAFNYVVPIIQIMLKICIIVIVPDKPIVDLYKYLNSENPPYAIVAGERKYYQLCENTKHTITLFNTRTIDGANHTNNGHFDLVLTKVPVHQEEKKEVSDICG
jgi:hypothetical protein